MIGSNVENFKILEVLGEGGMGIVYKAIDLKLERYVALKILGAQAITNPRFIERFKREAKNQAKLSHPNIVTVYGFTETSNTFGIAMEYISGETLDDLIERLGKIDLLTALRYIKQVLAGCSYSHNKGFIHRDIKPSNVIISHDGIAKIMDFGISKSLTEGKGITKTGAKLGTVLYMSPEQFKGQEPTRQSDIYSIGCTLYEMILGQPPFDLGSEFEIMEAHLKKDFVPLSELRDDVPTAIDQVLNKAMNKSIQKRYHSCEEFIHDINILITKIENTRGKGQIKKKLSKPLKLKYVILPVIIILLLGALFAVVLNQTSFLWDVGKNNGTNLISNGSPNSESLLNLNWVVNESPVIGSLNSICAINDSTIIVCGSHNTLLFSDDFGKTYISKVDSSQYTFTDIEFINAHTGFVIGENGQFFQTKDSGKNWISREIGNREQLTKIFFLKDAKTGFLITTSGKVFKSYNEGETWRYVAGLPANILYGISFYNNENGFIVGWGGLVLKTNDSGENWTRLDNFTDNYLKDIQFSDDKNGLIVGGGGEIFRSNDGGYVWKPIASGIISGLTSILLFTEKLSIILGSSGEILFSNDFGNTWAKSFSGTYAPLTSGVITEKGYVCITTQDGKIIRSENPIIDFRNPKF